MPTEAVPQPQDETLPANSDPEDMSEAEQQENERYWRSRRPVTRADCANIPRPCPFVSCRFHLYLDVNRTNGKIRKNFGDIDVDQIPESCVLDVADEEGASLQTIGDALGVTKERIRQIEAESGKRLRVRFSDRRMGTELAEPTAEPWHWGDRRYG